MSAIPDLEDAPCPLGCNAPSVAVLQGRDRLHGLPGRFRIVRCAECGLIRTSPRPTREAIGRFYPSDYGPHQDSVQANPTPEGGRARQFVRRALDLGANRCPAVPAGRLLEVGCGRGDFLASMRSQGWEVFGQDVSPQTIAPLQRREIPFHTGPISTLPDGGPYDLLAAFMVLEHLHDPVGDLRRLRELSADEAWLVLSTPNVRSLDFALFRARWFGLQLPTHLHHFEPQTLARVLDAGGWKVDRVIHQRTLADTAASLGYVSEDLGLPEAVTRKLSKFPEAPLRMRQMLLPAAAVVAAAHRSSRITVWARPQ